MSSWFYIRKGIIDDTHEGPFTNAAILQYAFDAKIKPKTLICHPTYTNGNWLEAETIPAIKQKMQAGESHRDAEALALRAEKESAKESAKLAKAEAKRQQVIETTARQAMVTPPPLPVSTPTPLPLPPNSTEPTEPGQTNDSTNRLLGFFGGAMLITGVFCPFVRVPFGGGIDYFRGGTGDGVIVLVLGVVAVCLTILRLYVVNLFPGILSLAMLLFTYISFQQRLAATRAEMEREMAGNPFRGIGEAMLGSVTIDWGFVLLIIAAILTILSAVTSIKPTAKSKAE